MTDHETDPKTLQQNNRKKAINNLRDVHAAIERLMNKTYRQQDVTASSALRQMRTRVTALLSEMENTGLDTFSGREGTLDEFYNAEEHFTKSSTRLIKAVEDAEVTDEKVDVFSLEDLVDALERGFNNRIILTQEHLKEYEKLRTESRKEEITEEPFKAVQDTVSETVADAEVEEISEDIDSSMPPELYNYINILEQKYSTYRPEISNSGDYIANKSWKVDTAEDGIRAVVKDGMFKTLLVFETYWMPLDNVQDTVKFVQSQANAVGKNQYKSLCLINSVWNNEVQNWAGSFVHQRMVLFLYELESGTLIFNGTSKTADNFKFWHSTDNQKMTLADEMAGFIEDTEYFTVTDVMSRFGLNSRGAEMYLDELVKKGKLVDVGLEKPKYTKSKLS
ncbi:MAG: hypothetical protein JXA98_09145 [Methanosarcinaceae archaeon]|nr:hypothetical protein [Methanosarcinaceae archaeon]